MDQQDLDIRLFTGGMVMTNGYLLETRGGNDTCLLIDAPLGVTEWLKSIDKMPTDLLLTHQHYDHVEDAAKLAAKGVKIHAFSHRTTTLTLEIYRQQIGVPIELTEYTVENLLDGKDSLEVGGIRFHLFHVPGHSPDSVAFVYGELAFVGDTLFANGIGRPDLPGGDGELLISGIREKLFTLDPETRVFPGHGPDTTIQIEQATNPYLQG